MNELKQLLEKALGGDISSAGKYIAHPIMNGRFLVNQESGEIDYDATFGHNYVFSFQNLNHNDRFRSVWCVCMLPDYLRAQDEKTAWQPIYDPYTQTFIDEQHRLYDQFQEESTMDLYHLVLFAFVAGFATPQTFNQKDFYQHMIDQTLPTGYGDGGDWETWEELKKRYDQAKTQETPQYLAMIRLKNGHTQTNPSLPETVAGSRPELFQQIRSGLKKMDNDDFLIFCQIHYPDVKNNLTSGMVRSQWERMLIDAGERRGGLGTLVAQINQYNAKKQKRYHF